WLRKYTRRKRIYYGWLVLLSCAWLWYLTMCSGGSAPASDLQGLPGDLSSAPVHQAIWVQLILFVVSIVLSELLRPKPNLEDARPAGLGDFQFTTATEGRPVPIMCGTNLMKGPNVVWYGDLKQSAIKETVSTGLWSSETFIKGFRYHIGVQMVLCRGSDDAPCTLLRVFVGEEEIYSGTVSGPEGRFDIDRPFFLGGDEFGSGGIQATVDFYSGTSTQPISAYLDDPDRQQIATAATPTAPRYSKSCHVVIRKLTGAAPSASNSGAYIGNSTTIGHWSFEMQRFQSRFTGQALGENIIGTYDANPINFAYELLTDTEWGFGFDPNTIDIGVGSTFLKASDNMIAEGNGMSWVIDRQIPAQQVLTEIERQIEGKVFLSPFSGKWEIQLIRGPDDTNFGYDVNTVPQVTDDELESIKDYTRGSWEDTTNNIQLKYDKRDDDYKESYAIAQDPANAILLAAGSYLDPVSQSGIVAFPGVKSSALAANLVWRELRGQCRPLARGTFIVNRKLYTLTIGGVFAWTSAKFGYTKLAMRATRIDYGTLTDNKMTITAVEDAFQFAAASYGTPPATGWTPPSVGLAAYPADEQVAFEAPRGIITREPSYQGNPDVSKVWCGARQQGSEVGFTIGQRNASGVPGGSYADAGSSISFLYIGQLDADLVAGVANPTSSILINSTPDDQTTLEALFDDTATAEDLGVGLVQLCLVNDEFFLVSSASTSGADVALENVYRGVLGTGQANHSAGDDVFLIFAGGNLTTTVFPDTNNVDVELRSRSSQAVYAGATTAVSLTMAQRAMRPYPPNAALYNGGSTPFTAPDLEGDGSGLNGVGFDIDWRRSRYTAGDEVAELGADNTPDASTEHRVRVYVAPAGANDLAFDSGWVSGTGPETPTQAELVTFAAAGTEIEVQIDSRHDIGTLTNLESWTPLLHRVTPTSTRSSQFYIGGNLSASTASTAYVAVSATVHNVTIGAAYSTSDVEAQINGGGWSVVIAASGTTGALNGGGALSISDSVELRHTVNETPDPQFVEIDDGTNPVAYGAFSA
ncbi:MAG TPA: phage tail protein, partial [Polyangiales bacterium]|nr:phage tail protein [Polyangiales bacterium]